MTIGNGASPVTVDVSSNNADISVGGDFKINAKAGFTASDSASFTVAGDWTNAGTFTAGTNTVTFDGSSAQTIITGGTGAGKDFYDVVFANTNGAITVSTNNITITNDVTLSRNTTITATNLDLGIAGAIDSQSTERSLAINTGATGDITVSGVIGGATALSSLNFDGSMTFKSTT